MSLKKQIIPAIIAKSQQELEDKINKVKDYVEIIQLDIMDGKFVPNNSIDFDFKLPDADCIFEAHLMIKNPEEWVKKHIQKVDMVLAHIESCKKPKKLVDLVKENGKRMGFVLNPETPLSSILSYVDNTNQVLIMTVNPGFYGSPFLPEMLDKIKKLRELKPYLDIEVDGGVTDKTIHLVDKAGANMFVSGSYIVKSDDVKESIANLKKIID
jgi:ribulose-phosphate 3-epimerase